ncbi:MAG: potassium channel family protein [Gammaproteobacteria bacterium]
MLFKILAQFKFLVLLLLLIAYFIAKTFIDEGHFEYIITILFAVLVAYSLYVIGHSKRLIFITALVAGLSVVSVLLTSTLYQITGKILIIHALLGVMFFFLIALHSLRYSIRGKRITADNLCGAICTYLLLGLAFSYLYVLISTIDSNAFAYSLEQVGTEDYIYYSFVTLTTLGYGDIVPILKIARTVSWLEAVTGQIYLTVLIAQLVALYIIHNK